ncbi:MAG: ABC transporter ATP-binding protein [Candidatus Puniceispirillum sp.]
MSDRVLEVKNLSVDIPLAEGVLHAVDGLNIHVDKGETLCIVGESGCGKSLTSLAIMDLLPKKAIRRLQQLDLGGTSILDYSERQMSDIRGNKMGMIFQEPMTSLNPAFTIGNQMVETLQRHRNITGAAARDLAKHMLEKVGITAADQRLNQYPHQLSGGLRQRVMIAMTLLCEPELIIADEPTTALDVTIQAQILLLLQELQSEFDMGLILITHDLGVVARIATRVAVMYAGQIVEQGTVQQIFENPMHPYTRGLMRCIPVPGKTKPGEPLGSIPGMVPSLVGKFTGCRFADRCSHATDACRKGDIDLRAESGKMQAYRCVIDPKKMAKVA